jgi:hypothetical protein
MIMEPDNYAKTDWCAKFGQGLRNAVTSAVNVAGGREKILGSVGFADTPAQRAKSWFINSYPLIGALVAGFDIIEVPEICQNEDIRVAAVNTMLKEIYINPAAGLTDQECRFVIAHEILHVGLRHDTRRQGRNGFLWNVACDYVINGWLIEIGLGEIPAFGGLYDPALKGESAEAIYDKIAVDLRLQRKLATLRGVGACDIIERDDPSWWAGGAGLDLDGFYRRCLMQGLEYHQAQGRGLLPRGMVEEIRSLAQPPIPWDVELAQWLMGISVQLRRRGHTRDQIADNQVRPISRVRITYRCTVRRRTVHLVLCSIPLDQWIERCGPRRSVPLRVTPLPAM